MTFLEAVLTKRQRMAGLYLYESGDHITILRAAKGKQIAVWNSTMVTVIEIRKAANEYLKEIK